VEAIDLGYTEAFGLGFVAGMSFAFAILKKLMDANLKKKVEKLQEELGTNAG